MFDKSELIVSISKLISLVGDLVCFLHSFQFLHFSSNHFYRSLHPQWMIQRPRRRRRRKTITYILIPFSCRKEMPSHQFLAELLKEEPRCCILIGRRGWTVKGRTLIPLNIFDFQITVPLMKQNFERRSKEIFVMPVGETLLAKHTAEQEWNKDMNLWLAYDRKLDSRGRQRERERGWRKG